MCYVTMGGVTRCPIWKSQGCTTLKYACNHLVYKIVDMFVTTLLQAVYQIVYETVNRLLQGCEQPCHNVATRLFLVTML